MSSIPPVNLVSAYNNNAVVNKPLQSPQVSLSSQPEIEKYNNEKVDRAKFIEVGKFFLDKVVKFVCNAKGFQEGLINVVVGDGSNELNELFDYLNKLYQEETPEKLSFKNIKNFISELHSKVMNSITQNLFEQPNQDPGSIVKDQVI